MVTFFELMRFPQKDELPLFQKGFLVKGLLVSAVLTIIYLDEGIKPILWYLAASLMTYLILMIEVMEHRIKKNKK